MAELDGSFFIGRDPKGFSLVLRFLRGDTFHRNSISDDEYAAFVDDVDYYGLPVEQVEQWLGRMLRPERFSRKYYSEGMLVSEDGLAAVRVGQEKTICITCFVMGANSYGGQDHVVITIHLERVERLLSVGVIAHSARACSSGLRCICTHPTHYAILHCSHIFAGDFINGERLGTLAVLLLLSLLLEWYYYCASTIIIAATVR